MVYSVTSARVPSAASARFLAFSLELMDLSVSSVAPSAADPAVAAKRALREHFKNGATLETLKSINSRLNARKHAEAVGTKATQ